MLKLLISVWEEFLVPVLQQCPNKFKLYGIELRSYYLGRKDMICQLMFGRLDAFFIN